MSKRSRRRARLRYRREVERMMRPAALRYLSKRFARAAFDMANGLNAMVEQTAKVMKSMPHVAQQREDKNNAG